MKIINLIVFLTTPLLLLGNLEQQEINSLGVVNTELGDNKESSAAPEVFCSKRLRIACLGEVNILTVKTENDSDIEKISWTLSVGANCISCDSKEIEVISETNGLVIATVEVLFSGGKTNSCMTSYWVGPPLSPAITYEDFPNCLPGQSDQQLFVEAPGAMSYLWNLPKCPSGSVYSETPDKDCWLAYDRLIQEEDRLNIYTGVNSGNITIKAINRCGYKTANQFINISKGLPSGKKIK